MGYYTIRERTNELTFDYRKHIILNKSNHSYHSNNKITSIFNNESFLNKECYIIGGGESLSNFNFNILKNKITIGINRAFEKFDFTINYSMDSTFYDMMKKGDYDREGEEKLWDKWSKFKGARVFLTPMEIKQFGNEVYLVKRNQHKFITRDDLDAGIGFSRNSGLGAILLAISLGANPIYLLGYDMQAKEKTHFHGGYEKNRDIVDFRQKLTGYMQEIEEYIPLIERVGVKIVNLNKESQLKCFPFGDLNEILQP